MAELQLGHAPPRPETRRRRMLTSLAGLRRKGARGERGRASKLAGVRLLWEEEALDAIGAFCVAAFALGATWMLLEGAFGLSPLLSGGAAFVVALWILGRISRHRYPERRTFAAQHVPARPLAGEERDDVAEAEPAATEPAPAPARSSAAASAGASSAAPARTSTPPPRTPPPLVVVGDDSWSDAVRRALELQRRDGGPPAGRGEEPGGEPEPAGAPQPGVRPRTAAARRTAVA